MKLFLKLGIIILILSATSCYGQQMVRKASEVNKLTTNSEQFIGNPLRTLLEQIKPRLKFIYGNPENTWAGTIGGTYLKFHFVDRNEYGKEQQKNKKSTSLLVTFQLEPKNSRKPLPKGGLKEWTDENTREYGDMIITKIRVTERS